MKNASIYYKVSFVGIILILLLVACESTPEGYMHGFERFVERVENNASSYTDEEWKDNDQQLRNYIEGYDEIKMSLSSDEKRKVGELTFRYYKSRVKSFGLNALGEIADWLDFINGFASKVNEDVSNQNNN